jgi:hypothetical protein
MSGIATYLVWHRAHREDEGDIQVEVIGSRNKATTQQDEGKPRRSSVSENIACEIYKLCVEGGSARSA